MSDQAKPEKLDLVEPDKTKIDQVIEAYDRAQKERRSTKEADYWQGRKDGLRVALAILEPGEDWERLNETSPGFRLEEKESLVNFIKSARYAIGAALWEYKSRAGKIDGRTLMNLLNWIGSYDQGSHNGDFPRLEDAIFPYDLYSRRNR